ncbi:MAG: efflux RND transporter periplasmic adaptor subunit [Planctomycetota bacterium]
MRAEREQRSAEVASARAEAEAASARAEALVDERAGRAVAEAMAREAEAARDLAVARRDEAALAVARSEIRAPIAGVVLARDVRPGSHVGGHPAPVFVLYDPSSLQVRCDVPLKEAGRLAVGAGAEIRVDALPGKVFRGRVTRIVPQADVQKNTVQCKVAIEDPDAALRPEMLARVRIAADGAEASVAAEVLAVPADALRAQAGDATAEVVVAIPDGRLARTELRRVELGPERANGWREIASGLAAGDRVVLDPAIAAGTRIAPAEAPRGVAP